MVSLRPFVVPFLLHRIMSVMLVISLPVLLKVMMVMKIGS
jgi:hypothetical protein